MSDWNRSIETLSIELRFHDRRHHLLLWSDMVFLSNEIINRPRYYPYCRLQHPGQNYWRSWLLRRVPRPEGRRIPSACHPLRLYSTKLPKTHKDRSWPRGDYTGWDGFPPAQAGWTNVSLPTNIGVLPGTMRVILNNPYSHLTTLSDYPECKQHLTASKDVIFIKREE